MSDERNFWYFVDVENVRGAAALLNHLTVNP